MKQQVYFFTRTPQSIPWLTQKRRHCWIKSLFLFSLHTKSIPVASYKISQFVFWKWTMVLRFGMTWGWVNNDRIYIFGWNYPFKVKGQCTYNDSFSAILSSLHEPLKEGKLLCSLNEILQWRKKYHCQSQYMKIQENYLFTLNICLFKTTYSFTAPRQLCVAL